MSGNIVKLPRNMDPLYILVQALPQLSNLLPLPSPTSPILHIASRSFFHPAIFMTSPYPSHPSSPPFPILCLSSHISLFLSFKAVASNPTPSFHQVPSRLLVFLEKCLTFFVLALVWDGCVRDAWSFLGSIKTTWRSIYFFCM